jgi:hypothetical protein
MFAKIADILRLLDFKTIVRTNNNEIFILDDDSVLWRVNVTRIGNI